MTTAISLSFALLFLLSMPLGIHAAELPQGLPPQAIYSDGPYYAADEAYWPGHSIFHEPATGHAGALPIDITAIGRTMHQGIALSPRFFELDLFSENSRIVNETIIEQVRLNREAIKESLFETFEAVRVIDIDEQIYHATLNLGLFAEPMRFIQMTQQEQSEEIPLWIIILVLAPCAALGYSLARAVLLKKGGKADVHNPYN